ncbi:hypothetical protein ABEV41_00370 [Geobacillus thermodenitrificans]|uniref:hypothetical protein n=1 Tax=Geobacillus thermodenitrificans TaxID=33940 RepID=UPI003D1D3381
MKENKEKIIDVSNLHIGQVFKNYKELCHTLGEPIKGGNAKKAQLKNWACYFSFTQQGHKFIINEIYDVPLIKEDKRSLGNNTVEYIDLIEALIIDLLAQDHYNGEVFLSKSRLLKELNMINSNYYYCRNRTLKLSEFMNIPEEEINDFYEITDNTLTRNLETALNRLRRQSLIIWSQVLTVCYLDTSVELNELGKVKIKRHKYINDLDEEDYTYTVDTPTLRKVIHKKATKEEKRLIIRTERELLKKYGCEEPSDIFRKGLAKQFYKEIKDILFEKANILYYYHSYEITFNHDHILEKWLDIHDLQLNDLKRESYQDLLNASIIDKLTENATIRHEEAKSIDINKIKKYKREIIKLRSLPQYISNTEKLADTLINNEAPDIRNKIHNKKLTN